MFHPVPLEPEDLRHLTAAHGYVELGMLHEANEELEHIDADVRHVPEVLATRVLIYHGLEKWELLQVVAKKLADCDPEEPQWAISLAYATRRADSIPAAKSILLEAVARHPNEAMFHFNLACYACQLGDLDAAKEFLARAISLDKRLRGTALNDEDLEPLWQSLTP